MLKSIFLNTLKIPILLSNLEQDNNILPWEKSAICSGLMIVKIRNKIFISIERFICRSYS
jgi:hypothetical protein